VADESSHQGILIRLFLFWIPKGAEDKAYLPRPASRRQLEQWRQRWRLRVELELGHGQSEQQCRVPLRPVLFENMARV